MDPVLLDNPKHFFGVERQGEGFMDAQNVERQADARTDSGLMEWAPGCGHSRRRSDEADTGKVRDADNAYAAPAGAAPGRVRRDPRRPGGGRRGHGAGVGGLCREETWRRRSFGPRDQSKEGRKFLRTAFLNVISKHSLVIWFSGAGVGKIHGACRRGFLLSLGLIRSSWGLGGAWCVEIIIMLTYTNSRLIRVNYSSTTLKGQGYPTLCRFCWGENSRKSDCTVLIRVIHGDDRYRALHVNSGRSAGWIAIIHDFSLRGVRIGEALKPGPRLRRRGPRSAASRDRRRLRWAERSRQMRRDENCNDKEVDMNEVFTDHKMSMLQVNMRGYISHIAEIAAMIRLMACKPFIVSLNETFLTRAIEHVELEGYTVLC